MFFSTGEAGMAERRPRDQHSPESQEARLTQAHTALLTQARMKTQSVRMREAPELPRSKSVSLLATDGPLKGTNFPIRKAQVVIGRADGDIIVSDGQVSRLHCVLEVHGLTALLVDLDSGNGTFVNGRKTSSSELDHMSEFRIGKTTLMFVITGR
jgi:hypothetical protein